MKKWKKIRNITIIFLITFIIIVLWNLISSYTSKVTYPYSALGMDINNWFEKFCLNMEFILYIFGIPMLLNIILLIVSLIKLKKLKKNN